MSYSRGYPLGGGGGGVGWGVAMDIKGGPYRQGWETLEEGAVDKGSTIAEMRSWRLEHQDGFNSIK